MTSHTVSGLAAAGALRLQEAGVPEPRFEAQLLLAHALGIERSQLLARLQDAVPVDARTRFLGYITRRAAREPTAYITGQREFYGHSFIVNRSVLIPRPETELLVELALERSSGHSQPMIADVGTGSGAVAISVALAWPAARVVATDTSQEALDVAKANARLSGVEERVRFVQADLLGGEGPFDVVLANLPYVTAADWSGLAPEVRDWEPRASLVGGERGTEIIERFLHATSERVNDAGLIALECGLGQAQHLAAVAAGCFPHADIRVRTDLAGIERVLEIGS